MESSYMYFLSIGMCCGMLAWHCVILTTRHAWRTESSVLIVGMLLVFLYEFGREWQIYQSGLVPSVTYPRSLLLRVEYMWFGCYLCEVYRYATKNTAHRN